MTDATDPHVQREGATGNTKTVFTLLIAVFFASTFAWTDGASGQQSRTEKRAERSEEKAEKLAERAESLKEEAGEGGGEFSP